MRRALILAIAIAWATNTLAQLPPRDPQRDAREGTAALRGRVVAADTGVPLRETVVSVEGAMDASTFTDAKGEFEFVALAPGEYRLRVVSGPASARYLPLAASDRPVFQLSGDQLLEGVEVRLQPAAAISGRVLDEYGEPLAFARSLASVLSCTSPVAENVTRSP